MANFEHRHVRRLALLSFTWALSSTACLDELPSDLAVDDDAPSAPALPVQGSAAAPAVPTSGSIDQLPQIDHYDSYVQLLPEPTARGENVALHVELPPPHNPALTGSLVRLLGDETEPLVLYKTDALVELGVVPSSPGPDFYTTFVTLDDDEPARRELIEAELAHTPWPSGKHVVFHGRTPVALRTSPNFPIDDFLDGALAALGPCPVMPASSLARWEESLLIRDPAVVQDPTRTWDACTAVGDPAGVWTFHHLMAEMAAGAVPAVSVEEFTLEWLETWLDDQPVNGDSVAARPNMFNLVIEPWALASGVTATLTTTGPGGSAEVVLSGPLDWTKSPFRLSAIVNRIDLGASGSGGYGGSTSVVPQTAGELRFVFGIQDPLGCGLMPFSIIFEYGVPRTTCEDVRDWAVAWTQLNDPSLLPRFSPTWLAQLETMTESVVSFGAAPSKGNDNAINQVRTNENALDGQWELREFTLTIESPLTFPNDTPADGLLRPHSVAMTPDDAIFAPTPNPIIDQFVLNDVLPTVGTPVTLPADCRSDYQVPLEYLGAPLRGGGALVNPVDFWEAVVNPSVPAELCARHEFSLNTCNGCHFGDTQTSFLHVDPTLMPAGLSDFLTGGLTSISSVPDSQFPTAVTWTFADLERRYNRLYEIACDPCAVSMPSPVGATLRIADVSGVAPIDRLVADPNDPPIGPITVLDHVAQILANESAPADTTHSVELSRFIRPSQRFVH